MNLSVPKIFSAIGGAICIAIIVVYVTEGKYLKTASADDTSLQLQYSELVTHQLLSEWECLPATGEAREAFILKIMQRFLPDDWKQVESSREWMHDYKSKQLSGTLMVEERQKLQDAYEKKILPWRTDLSELDQHIINSTNLNGQRISLSECVMLPADSCRKSPYVGAFIEPSCVPCQQPIISFSANSDSSEVQIFYEDNVIKWNPSNPPDFIGPEQKVNVMYMGEYHALQTKGELGRAITSLEKQKQRDDALKTQARDTIMKMKAADIPSGIEKTAIQQEYLRLKCHTN